MATYNTQHVVLATSWGGSTHSCSRGETVAQSPPVTTGKDGPRAPGFRPLLFGFWDFSGFNLGYEFWEIFPHGRRAANSFRFDREARVKKPRGRCPSVCQYYQVCIHHIYVIVSTTKQSLLFFREVCISTPLDFHLLLLSVQHPWRCESHTQGHREGRSGVYKSPHQPVPPDQEAVQPVEGGSAAHTGQWNLCQRYRLGEVYFTIEIFIKFFGTEQMINNCTVS